jgi:hypothetical protein
VAEQRFTDNILKWNDRRLDGRRRQVDQSLGAAMGGTARSGLQRAAERYDATAANTSNKAAVRTKAAKGADMARRLEHVPGVQDRPTTISRISSNYASQFNDIVQKTVSNGDAAIPGTAWYYEHRRGAESALPDDHGLSDRQIAAMSAKLSSGKTPEDERLSMAGIHELASTHASTKVDGRAISDMSSTDLASRASREASWSSFTSGKSNTGTPEAPRPDVEEGHSVQDALRRAGRAHQDNIASAMDIVRGNITPHEAFTGATPKTAAYGEMIASSHPGSVEEIDYRNISQHVLDVAKGTQIRGQGMMVFSNETPESRPYTLQPDSPTAIDTWMYASGSGQPASAPNVDPSTGERAKGRSIRVSKRMVDKNMPLDASTKTKAQTGLEGTDVSVTPVAAAAAQHMEAVTRASKKIGPISHDQHGRDVYIPSSLIQETVWTNHRREAGADSKYNTQQQNAAKAAKDAADKAAKARGTQGELF